MRAQGLDYWLKVVSGLAFAVVAFVEVFKGRLAVALLALIAMSLVQIAYEVGKIRDGLNREVVINDPRGVGELGTESGEGNLPV